MEIEVNGKILTFCGKCRKEISCGERITHFNSLIKEKVVICKECSREASAMCHSCCLPIFKHELIHEISVGGSIGNENRSENLIQCHSCYEILLIDTKQKKRSLLKGEVGNNGGQLFLITYSGTMLAFTMAGEPKSIGDAKIKNGNNI